MARIRTIKPDFFTSEDIVSLSPLARLLYISTWLEADREGRLVWRPKTMKLRYLPGDNCDIEALADELVMAGLVVPYSIDGQNYAEIPSFIKHQVINNRESPGLIPPRDDNAITTRAPRVNDATPTPLMGKERKGKEEKGKETPSPAKASEEILPRPECVPSEVWDAFMEVRKGLKAKNTPPAICSLINQLEKLRNQGHDPVEVVERSIRSSWKDLYPVKNEHQARGGSGRNRQETIEHSNREATAGWRPPELRKAEA